MNFVIRRYFRGVSTRRSLLWLALAPPLLYLFGSSILPDRYVVEQSITISKDAPIAVATSPVDARPLTETVAEPQEFFQNAFTLKELDETVLTLAGADQSRRLREISALVGSTMGLKVLSDDATVVTYEGPDNAVGAKLVTYFSDRLSRKAEEGVRRQSQRQAGPFRVEAGEVDAVPAELGSLKVTAQRSYWRSERMAPALWVFSLSILAVLVACGILEWSDPSFKSERQVGRYLGKPVLGSFPDMVELSAKLRHPTGQGPG